jgi:hypothetical protein
MLLARRLVYSPSEEALNQVKDEINNSHFGDYKRRIDNYWMRKEE